MLLCNNDIAAYTWSIHSYICGDPRRWVWSSGTCNSYLLQYFSTTDPTSPTSGLRDVHFRGTVVLGYRTSHYISRIWYETPLVIHHPFWSAHRPSGLLSHRLSRGTIQRKQGPDSRSAQDYSTRRDVLFHGYIHFTSRARNVSSVRKCKDIVTVLYLLSKAHLDFYSVVLGYSLPRKWWQNAFPSFIHPIFSAQ